MQIVWRQRFVVIAAVALAIVLSGVYLLVATPIYKSEARIVVTPAGGAQVLPRNDGQSNGPGTINLYLQAEILSSTPILANTLTQPGIQELTSFENVDNRFEFIKNNLHVEVGSKDDLITASFNSPIKEDAAKILETVIHSYKEFQTKKSQTRTDHLLEVLGNERRSLEEALQAKSKEMVEFKRQHGVLFDVKDRGDINVERVRFLLESLTKAQGDTVNARLAYEEALRTISNDPEKLLDVKAVQARGGLTPVTAEDEALLRNELFQWQTRLSDIQRQYLPNHPHVRSLKKRIDELTIGYVAAMERRYLGAQKREAELEKAYDQQQKVASNRSADAFAFSRLEQDLQNKQNQIQAIDKQIRDLNLSEAASAAVDVSVVEEPRVTDRPAFPDKRKVIAIGTMLGLVFGLGLAFVRDWADPRLRSTEEIKAVLGMPILGMVPRMPENLAPAVRGQKLLLDPGSEAAEAYRALRTAIKFGVPEGRAKTILVTSPSPADGKTTVASNLAIALAQVGKRVLLLDADLRHPKQHETFGIENHSGLGDVLAHDLTPAEVTHKTVVQNLELMPAGPTPENPADLLNSPRFHEVMEGLTDRYDHVIVDTPPVLAVTDSRIIAASCDVSVLVLRADRADRKMCEMSRDGLVSVGANLVGLVMNFVPAGSGVYSGANAYYRTEGDDTHGARRSSASPADADHGEHSATPLVAIDAMKSMGKRPNQLSR